MAFYAALSNNRNTRPFQAGMMLKYTNVFTNVGKAYNKMTGELRQFQVAPALILSHWFPLYFAP